jgi:hypothetical protein
MAKMGATSGASSLSTLGEIPSGPGALYGFSVFGIIIVLVLLLPGRMKKFMYVI